MIIEIICPECNFSKKVYKENIPEGVKFADCPRCGTRFEIDLKDKNKETAPGQVITSVSNYNEEEDFWKSIYLSLRRSLFSPKQFFKNMELGNGISDSFSFGLLLGSIGTMFGWFWQFLILSNRGNISAGNLPDLIISNLSFYIILCLCPLFVILKMFLIGSIIHFGLIVSRGAKNGFEGTFKVIAYSQSAQMFSFIPFIGGFTGFVWQLIIMIIGLKGIHRSSTASVIMALIIPFGFIAFIIATLIISASVFLFST